MKNQIPGIFKMALLSFLFVGTSLLAVTDVSSPLTNDQPARTSTATAPVTAPTPTTPQTQEMGGHCVGLDPACSYWSCEDSQDCQYPGCNRCQ